MSAARRLRGAALAAALRDSRAHTLSLVADLEPDQWRVPQWPGLNPPAWELAHLAWFAEFWVLRGPHRTDDDGLVHAARPARLAGPDHRFDSSRCPHARRWSIPLPSPAELRDRLAAQLADTLSALARLGHDDDDDDDDQRLYPYRLALFHEDMHGEALCWLRDALGLPAPAGIALPEFAPAPPLRFAPCETTIGVQHDERGFAFDNEQPARMVALAAFQIDAQPVCNRDYLRFVEAGGYERADCWPGAAGAWRAAAPRAHPQRWRRGPHGHWQQRWFDRWRPLAPDEPVVHVNAWEAEAYCRWAGRRLPSAAEWEHAAPRLQWGRSVWEWTADAFLPYPGFTPGPYRDYSAPWFGDHRELRGGACATPERLHDHRWRNFFVPERTDVFAGFRTASTV
jgi:ergothioneine biosynthesis protein EgtB